MGDHVIQYIYIHMYTHNYIIYTIFVIYVLYDIIYSCTIFPFHNGDYLETQQHLSMVPYSLHMPWLIWLLQTFDLARRSRSLSVEPNLYVWCQVKRLLISVDAPEDTILKMSMAPFQTSCQMVLYSVTSHLVVFILLFFR